jgi:hypothetical protein
MKEWQEYLKICTVIYTLIKVTTTADGAVVEELQTYMNEDHADADCDFLMSNRQNEVVCPTYKVRHDLAVNERIYD